jgi:Carboxypeptidase regulatory-like domain
MRLGVFLAALTLLPAMPAMGWECVGPKPLLTSDVSVQAFFPDGTPAEGANVELHGYRNGEYRVLAEVITNRDGHVRVERLGPGAYDLIVTMPGYDALRQPIRVVRGLPKRMLLIGLGVPMRCSQWCWSATTGPSERAPACVAR